MKFGCSNWVMLAFDEVHGLKNSEKFAGGIERETWLGEEREREANDGRKRVGNGGDF